MYVKVVVSFYVYGRGFNRSCVHTRGKSCLHLSLAKVNAMSIRNKTFTNIFIYLEHMRACVRACVHVLVYVCVRACMCMCVCECVSTRVPCKYICVYFQAMRRLQSAKRRRQRKVRLLIARHPASTKFTRLHVFDDRLSQQRWHRKSSLHTHQTHKLLTY